jgi:hypothetical protein
MPGQPPGKRVLAVIAALEDAGEMTRAEICRAMGVDRFIGSAVMSRMHKATPMIPKRIYIARWVYEDDVGGRRYPKAVFALGDKKDAPKPKPKLNKVSTAEYRDKEQKRVNSVFMWGQSRRVRHAARKKENHAVHD